MSAPLQVGNSLEQVAGQAIRRATGWLACVQARDGHWCAELTADTTLESDYILFQLWLEPPVNGVWNPASRSLIDKAVRSILGRQLPDGGFNIYVGGPSEVSASVKAYFALKLAGLPVDDDCMVRLRQRMSELVVPTDTTVDVTIPYDRGDLVARVHADGRVDATEHTEVGTRIKARVPVALAAGLREFATF